MYRVHDGEAPTELTAGEGLYYGLALDDQGSAWVAARRALVSDERPPESERGQLVCLGPDRPGRTVAPGGALRDIHGIAHHAGKFWITCSYDDTVAIVDPATGACQWWQPLATTTGGGKDQYHFNSLWFEGERVWLTAHRHGPSRLLAFDRAAAVAGRTTAALETIALGRQAHNVWRQANGELCTCSSIEGRLLGERGWRLETGAFPRGVAALPGGWVVGLSALNERRQRDFADAELVFYNHRWRERGRLPLPGVGMVLDLLLVPAALPLRPLPAAAYTARGPGGESSPPAEG